MEATTVCCSTFHGHLPVNFLGPWQPQCQFSFIEAFLHERLLGVPGEGNRG